MKVFDIVNEETIEEGPLDYVKRAVGSKTAATKIDMSQETKRLANDFKAFYKNTPDGVPTTGLLLKFLQDAGLPIGSEKEIIAAMRKNPSMARKLGSAAKGTASALGKAAKGAAGAVSKGAAAVGQAVKGPAPIKPKDGEAVMTAGMYESLMEAELAPGDIAGIIKHFVQKGLQTKGADVKRSKYAAPAQQPQAEPASGEEPITPAVAPDANKVGMGARQVGNKLGAKGGAGMMSKALDKVAQGGALPANLSKQIAPFAKQLEVILGDPGLRNKFMAIIAAAETVSKKNAQTQPAQPVERTLTKGKEKETKLVSAPKGVDQGPNSAAAGGTGEKSSSTSRRSSRTSTTA